MLCASQAGTCAWIQLQKEGGARPADGIIAPSSTRALEAIGRNGRKTTGVYIRQNASIAGSIGNGALVPNK